MRTQSGVTASAGQSPEIPPSRGKSWFYVNLEQNNVKLPLKKFTGLRDTLLLENLGLYVARICGPRGSF